MTDTKQTLSEFLAARGRADAAKSRGTDIHALLQHIMITPTPENYGVKATKFSSPPPNPPHTIFDCAGTPGAGAGKTIYGNPDLIEKIIKNPEIARFFTAAPGVKIRTEVPIAGTIDGRFVSRRIDRMIIYDTPTQDSLARIHSQAESIPPPAANAAGAGKANRPAGSIEFLDYKTDADRGARREKYENQMREYAALLAAAYPGRCVRGYILWLHDWELERFV
ncbi:MAG: hypothetical protein FWC51_05000 [Proteobacteria bacterium]|nr:hypothetical protein [Pseudomonadota bacterium]